MGTIMSNLLELSRAAHSLAVPRNHTILIYGDPKSGKTRLAATVAKIPQVRRVFFFDGENGSDTLLSMVRSGALNEEEAAKVILIKVLDTPDQPYFIETILRTLFAKKNPVLICALHGRVACPTCTAAKVDKDWTSFDITSLGHDDWVVIDTGSQLAQSAMEAGTKGWGYEQKPGFDEYGMQGRMLSDIMTFIQAATTNFIMVTHQCVLRENVYSKPSTTTTGKATMVQESLTNTVKLYPLMGTKNFSLNVAKYFGTVIYTDQKLRKHVAGSSSTYDSDMITGSRIDIVIEKAERADLSLVLPKAGLYPETETKTGTDTEIKNAIPAVSKT